MFQKDSALLTTTPTNFLFLRVQQHNSDRSVLRFALTRKSDNLTVWKGEVTCFHNAANERIKSWGSRRDGSTVAQLLHRSNYRKSLTLVERDQQWGPVKKAIGLYLFCVSSVVFRAQICWLASAHVAPGSEPRTAPKKSNKLPWPSVFQHDSVLHSSAA